MLTTGLDGGRMTASAAAIASSTPGAGEASSAPTRMICSAGTEARSRTHHSWKWTARRPRSSEMTTWVSVLSSLIGIRRTPGRQRAHSASVTADRGYPASSIWVRTMWVAKSRSPRPNHCGSTP